MNVDTISRAVVDRAIDQASARLRTVSALSGAMLIVAGGIAYVAVAVLADHFFPGGLSLAVRRMGLALAGLLLAVFTITRIIRPAFRRVNQLYSAWLLERARPDLRHAVTTTLLLRKRDDVHAGVTSGLAFQAARAVRHMDVQGVVSDRSLRRAGGLVIAVIAAFGLYGLFAPKQVRPSLMRVMGADVPAPTQTSVDIIAPPPDASVVVGTPVAFEVALRGRIPREAWVEFSPDEGQTWSPGKRLSLIPPRERGSESSAWTATRDGVDVAATHWYRVHAGDARCEIRKIEVRPQPVVTAHTVEVTWPEYSNRVETTRTDGPIDALVGSKAALTVRTNVPAADGRVIFHDAAGDFSRQMTIDQTDRHTLRAAWIVDRDLEYEVQFNDLHGAATAAPIRYTQRARGDRPPEIVHLAPEARFEAAANDEFRVRARITDDWGLTKVVMAYRGPRGSGVVNLLDDTQSGQANIEIDKVVPVPTLGARTGDVVELHLEATDSRLNLRGERDSQVTRGPTCELRVSGEKSGKGGGDSKDQKGGAGGPGPNKNGNQPGSGANDGPGQKDNQGAAGKPEKGNPQKGDQSGKPNDASAPGSDSSEKGVDSSDAKKQEEASKPQEADSQKDGAARDSADMDAPTSEGDAPDSAKPTPTSDHDQNPPDESSPPLNKPTNSSSDSDAQPGDGSAESDSADAQSKLDRLIRENQKAMERLGEKGTPRDGDTSEKSGDAEPSADAGSASKQGEESKGISPDKKDAKKGDGAKGGTESKEKTGENEKGGESSQPKGDPTQANKSGQGESSKSKEGSDSKKGDSSKGDSSPNGGDAGDKSEAGEKSEKQKNVEGSRTETCGGDPAQDVELKGDARAKPGDAQPGESESKSKAESGEFAKDPGKVGNSKDGQPGASTPKPAEAVGPTPPSSGNGVTEDAGPSNADGSYDGEGKSNPLGAPQRDRARRAVDELERRLRDGGISDAELRDLGWSRAEARNFVERFKRLHKAAQAQRDGGLFTGKVREDSGEGRPSINGPEAGVGRGMTGAVRGDKGTARDAAHSQDAPPESVPPELKDVLDEYYRSMARQGGAKAPSDK